MILFFLTLNILLTLTTQSIVKECSKKSLTKDNTSRECLRKLLTISPTECESDSNISTEKFIENLGQNYQSEGLIPVDAYFFWEKIRNEIKNNKTIIPKETRGYQKTLNNKEYGQILQTITGLKPWKVTDDCTIWSTLQGKKQQQRKSADAWINLAKLLKTKNK